MRSRNGAVIAIGTAFIVFAAMSSIPVLKVDSRGVYVRRALPMLPVGHWYDLSSIAPSADPDHRPDGPVEEEPVVVARHRHAMEGGWSWVSPPASSVRQIRPQ
jgi:hypothetical protein